MFDKLLIALGFAVVLYVIWLFVSAAYFTPTGKRDNFIIPAEAPFLEEQMPVEPQRLVAPGGPSSPNAADTSQEALLPPEVNGTDPFAEDHTSSNLTDNLRYPERMFSAGVRNTDTSLGPMAGIASEETQVSGQALQTFSPESAMNGGFFMNGISANDADSKSEFASF